MPQTTSKKQLSCRVSSETYNSVMSLVSGNMSPYESTSEYIYSLILMDIGRRRVNNVSEIDDLRKAIFTDESMKQIWKRAREIVQEELHNCYLNKGVVADNHEFR